MSLRPHSMPRLASSIPSPRRFVKAKLNRPKCVRRSLAISAHFPLVEPAADLGFTITSGSDPLLEKDLLVVFDKVAYFLDRFEITELVVAVFAGGEGLARVYINHIFVIVAAFGLA